MTPDPRPQIRYFSWISRIFYRKSGVSSSSLQSHAHTIPVLICTHTLELSRGTETLSNHRKDTNMWHVWAQTLVFMENPRKEYEGILWSFLGHFYDKYMENITESSI